jgi:hypothetical protein
MKRLIVLLLCVGCGGGGGGGDDGDDDGGGPAIAGGGVTGAPIDGALDVYVVEPGGEVPIAGAEVHVGALSAVADADGHVAFADASLTGAQTVTATAAGRTAATWFGVDGASVTLPLAPQPLDTPSAHVTGTIAGWDDLPTPSFDHYNLGLVLYTFTDDIAAPENRLTQPTDGNGAPLDTCLMTAVSNSCDWEMVARVGQQRHFAIIVDGDTNGTTSDSTDDTYTLIGYAISPSMTLTDGQQVSGETLTMIDATLSPLTVSFPAAPGGLGNVVAIPTLDLGDDGRFVFPLPTLSPGHLTTQVLPPTGEFAGNYDLVALATPVGAAVPYSTTFQNDISLGGTSTFPAWLPLPASLTAGGRSFSFTSPDGASIDFATFTRADGTAVWNVSVLDGASSFELPALTPDPLGTAPLTFTVASAEVPGFDPTDFRVLDLPGALHRAAGASTAFTP